MSSEYDAIATPDAGSSRTATVVTVTPASHQPMDEDEPMAMSPQKAFVNGKSTPHRMNTSVQKFINFTRFRPSRPTIAGMTNPE
jgi:hypothetical protein